MVDGVSMPSGIAVTSSLPVRRASRIAIHVYTRLPSSTPSAVPGEHAREDDVRREPEASDQDAREHGEVHDVVEHQPEEGIDVADREPSRGANRVGHDDWVEVVPRCSSCRAVAR